MDIFGLFTKYDTIKHGDLQSIELFVHNENGHEIKFCASIKSGRLQGYNKNNLVIDMDITKLSNFKTHERHKNRYYWFSFSDSVTKADYYFRCNSMENATRMAKSLNYYKTELVKNQPNHTQIKVTQTKQTIPQSTNHQPIYNPPPYNPNIPITTQSNMNQTSQPMMVNNNNLVYPQSLNYGPNNMFMPNSNNYQNSNQQSYNQPQYFPHPPNQVLINPNNQLGPYQPQYTNNYNPNDQYNNNQPQNNMYNNNMTNSYSPNYSPSAPSYNPSAPSQPFNPHINFNLFK